eukprot:g410.t1
MIRSTEQVARRLGLPFSHGNRRKFLLKDEMLSDVSDVPVEEFQIEETYLKVDGAFRKRLRKRWQAHQAPSFKIRSIENIDTTDHTKSSQSNTVERNQLISARDYGRLLSLRDLSRGVARKTRKHFVWGSHVWEVDSWSCPLKGNEKENHGRAFDSSCAPDNGVHHIAVVEIPSGDNKEQLDIPPFLNVDKEVTNDPRWRTSEITRHGFPPKEMNR